MDQKRANMLQRLKELASSYVPDWKFDEENADIGTALALVYGDMMASVQTRYEHVMEKKQIDFLNTLGAELKAATPAKGYVSFELSKDMPVETQVPSSTVVTAECKEAENGRIAYETLDDLLVTPAALNCVFETGEAEDYISSNLKDADNNLINTLLFQQTAPNMQTHKLYIGHPEVFDVSGDVRFTLSFFVQKNLLAKEEFLTQLVEEEAASICYVSREGLVPFEKTEVSQGKLVLYRGAGQPAFAKTEIEGEENYWIQIKVNHIEKLQYFSFERASLMAKAQPVLPDTVLADGMEADLHQYFPFGERLSVYSEVYFVSDQVFGKHGAKAELAFYLSFASIPLDTNVEETEIKWDWVMAPEDFEKQKEYDVTIASVTWEYYNGMGWARLYPDRTNETVFTPSDSGKGRYMKINFVCPRDMEKAFIGSVNAYAIRARITKLNNPFKLNGRYVSPVLQNTTVSFQYEEKPIEQLSICSDNNLAFQKWNGESFRPFLPVPNKGSSLYLGFSKPLQNGPIKMYFKFREAVSRANGSLKWEYWNGQRFEPLRMIDETADFSKSGLVTFLGADNFSKTCFFGAEQYWLRITDENYQFEGVSQQGTAPFLEAVVMNTVKIENREAVQEEYFQMEYFVRHKKFRLQKKNIQSARVYVKEAVIGSTEQEWKEWKQVPDFLDSDEHSEHFRLNQNEGYIQFGDGSCGKIPPVSREDNIKAVYYCGGGFITNAAAGNINKLSRSIGFINKVYNTEAASGGLDMEERKRAIKRCSSQIRMRGRAVTVRDYENLAYEASGRIEKAKCFPGMNGDGNRLHGAITIVLLLKDYKLGNTVFQGVRDTVERYLKGKMPEGIYTSGKLFLVEPVFVIFHVKAVLVTEDIQYVFQIQKEVEEKLNQFFDPLSGNFDREGWEMGYLPTMIQLRNLIHMTEHVEEIQSIFVTSYRWGKNGMEEIELEQVKECPFVLPMNGTHHISITY